MQFLAMNPIGMVIVAIALLIFGIKYLIDNFDLLKESSLKAFEKIKEVFVTAKDFILEKITEIGDFITKYHPLAILSRVAAELLPKIVEKFVSIGSDLVEGIKQGINNAWAAFKTWFIAKIGNPIQWAKQVLGIASPSKVFASIGENVVAGYIQGIDSMSSQLQNTVGDMAMNSTVAFDGASSVPSSMPSSSATNVYNINVNAGMGTNGAQVGKEIVDAIKRFEKTSGPVFASA
jgi:hypothetical protein